MKDSLTIHSITANPGEIAYGYIKVGELQDGTSITIPVAIVNGKGDGSIIYIQSLSDGDELNGIAVIHRLLNILKPEDLNGAIIAVPLVNPFAFHYRQSESIVDKKKMNRCFPGRPDGSSSERIAYLLFHDIVVRAQYCIDLHQCSINPMVDSVNVRVGRSHRMYKQCLELARVFGIGYIFDQKGPQGQLARIAPENGIPAIDPELGGSHGWDDVSIQKGLKGILNVLKFYGFIEGKPEIPDKQVVIRSLQSVYSNHGGFIRYHVDLYDTVKSRSEIADILDVFGRRVEAILSPCNGILWMKNSYPMAFSGSLIATIGTNIRRI